MERQAVYTDVLLPLPIYGTFTYAVPIEKATGLLPGMRVVVPFGKKNTYTGLAVSVHERQPGDYETKEIHEVLDTKPVVLDSQLLFWKWMSQYYMCSEGEVFKAALPSILSSVKKRRSKKDIRHEITGPSSLNKAQNDALQSIQEAFHQYGVVLLHGVTSSGKTEIYIQLIREALENRKQVLYLLPEIALTTQIISRLTSVFGNRVGVYHSKHSSADRAKIWDKLLSFDPADPEGMAVVLGVRSAIFLPFKDPGLVIIDEEHENTYKQFDPAPRYHARDSAIMLAKFTGAKVLLGTATPSIESYYNCENGKYKLVELNERYLNLQLPEIIIENTKELRRKKKMHSHFSPLLLDTISETLKNREQVILFQNRRGFSLFLECNHCGEVPKCRHCDVSLTYHKKDYRLYCHYCGYNIPVSSVCPACHTGSFEMRGFGTERIEEEIAHFFPEAGIERMDIDSTRTRKSFESLIARFENRESDILVGTQMVSKGLDFDNVKLVGIMNADNLLNYPDFRAYERSYQLMSQVSGRAGRKNSRGKVIIQTSSPDHPIISYVLKNDYKAMFYNQIEERKKFRYPPFSRLVEITIKHRDNHLTDRAADFLALTLRNRTTQKIMGPEYPLVNRIHNLFLKKLLIKIEKGNQIEPVKSLVVEIINRLKEQIEFRQVHCVIDVDPY